MPIDESKFRCSYTVKFFAGSWRHEYVVLCKNGAISFHWADSEGRFEKTAGLEIHRYVPAEYQKDHAPHHSPCHILGAPCWHDGTSLYATEKLLPLIDGAKLNHAFDVLINECADRFMIGGKDA